MKKKFINILVFASLLGTTTVVLVSCASPGYAVLAVWDTACPHRFRKPQIAFTDLLSPPSVTVIYNSTILIGGIEQLLVSDFWPVPKVQVKNGKVMISAYYSCREKYAPFTIKLSSEDMRLIDVPFFWIDPDGLETKLKVGK